MTFTKQNLIYSVKKQHGALSKNFQRKHLFILTFLEETYLRQINHSMERNELRKEVFTLSQRKRTFEVTPSIPSILCQLSERTQKSTNSQTAFVYMQKITKRNHITEKTPNNANNTIATQMLNRKKEIQTFTELEIKCRTKNQLVPHRKTF